MTIRAGISPGATTNHLLPQDCSSPCTRQSILNATCHRQLLARPQQSTWRNPSHVSPRKYVRISAAAGSGSHDTHRA
jgi:hypothetical protein